MKPYEMALSVRQPWAEQILLGVKTAEIRSRRTWKIGVPFYLYAARQPGPVAEFARIGCAVGELPTGVLVGVATISRCERLVEGGEGLDIPGAEVGKWAWVLEGVTRLREPVETRGMPQAVWWRPFAEVREPGEIPGAGAG